MGEKERRRWWGPQEVEKGKGERIPMGEEQEGCNRKMQMGLRGLLLEVLQVLVVRSRL